MDRLLTPVGDRALRPAYGVAALTPLAVTLSAVEGCADAGHYPVG